VRSVKSESEGFALLETIAAITIIGIVLVTALSGISSYVRAGRAADNLSNAAVIGQTELAGILSGEIRAAGIERSLDSEFPGFSVVSSLENIDKYTDRLNVSVKWKEYGKDKEELFATCIFKAGNEK
jgi:type II secretory pathway pseudopilin PulG